MNIKTKKNFRLVVDFSDKAVSRVSVRELSRDGKYKPLARPWGIKVLAALKLASKAVTLTSRGVADLEEVCRTVSAPRRRKLGKTPPVEHAGVHTTNRTDVRRNSPDHDVARSVPRAILAPS
jgi:hypothetical protein